MDKIVIVVIWDRSVTEVVKCDTIEEAVEAANDLLKNHAAYAGYLDVFESGDSEGDGWCLATEDNRNAWANWQDIDWDAHIIEC